MKYIIKTGTDESESAASKAFQSLENCPMNCCAPSVTVRVASPDAKTSGNQRSFHMGMMEIAETVPVAGRMMGKISQNTRLFAGAIHARGVFQFARHMAHELRQYEDRERQAPGHIDHDQSP